MPGTLHLVCGKIAAGKSTLCARLGAAPNSVTISEDAWLKSLFGDEMKDASDYIRVSAKLRPPMGNLVADLSAPASTSSSISPPTQSPAAPG